MVKTGLPVLEPVGVPQASLAKKWTSQGKDQKWSWWPQGNAAGYTHTNSNLVFVHCATL